jgi:tetratricopeptide (TPR) repeat protein
MSLLLDALKKAAQDKQNSANNAAGNTPPTKPVDELELTLDLDALPAATRADELTALGDTQADEPALQINDVPTHAMMADDLPTLAADIKPPPAEIRHEAAVVPKPVKPQAPPAQPTPPTAEAIKPPQPSASSRSATSSAAVLAAQQAAAKQRDALDMMINKSRQSNDQKRNIQLYGLIIFCLLLLILGGIYFYAGSEPVPPVAETSPIATEAATAVEPIVKIEPVQPAAPVAQPAPTQHASSNIPPPRRAVATASKPAAAKPAAEPLQFNRTTRPDPIESLLAQAYEKFQAADYTGANELYTQVLLREADSRDGLLGAAAVAMKQQRLDYARQKYQQLLILDPKDSIARAGMSTIDMDIRDESKLKFMLREQPESPHLYFALGALYASQARWAEAQQAYFSALSGDNTNADYAYNLAVSLDRLSQYKAASTYYQKARLLSDARRGGFVDSDLQSRIEQIARLPDAPR